MKNCIEYNVELDSLLLLSSTADSINENCIEFYTNSESLTISVQENTTTTTNVVGTSNGIARFILDDSLLKKVSTIFVWATDNKGISTTPIQIVTKTEITSSDIVISLFNGIFYCKSLSKTDKSGATFTPVIDSNGNLSWVNNKGLENPETINIIGPQGRGIVSVIRTSGNGAPGTTDIYTITYSDDTTSTFSVYNGSNGTGGNGGGYVIQPDAPEDTSVLWIDTDDESNDSSGLQMNLLWQNASPTSNFAPQTISVANSGYDLFAIHYQFGTASDVRGRLFQFAVSGVKVQLVSASYQAKLRFRAVNIDIDDSNMINFVFAGGYEEGGQQNGANVPIQIYGIKGVRI